MINIYLKHQNSSEIVAGLNMVLSFSLPNTLEDIMTDTKALIQFLIINEIVSVRNNLYMNVDPNNVLRKRMFIVEKEFLLKENF